MRASQTALLILCIGCNNPRDSDDSGAPGGEAACDGEPVDEYTPGIERLGEGGRLSFAVEDAAPDPPDEGDNTWRLLLTQGGAGLDGAEVTLVPTMPAHGHGTSPESFQGQDRGDGRYEIGPFDLIMPGVWRFEIAAGGASSDESDESDEVVFTFCVEG